MSETFARLKAAVGEKGFTEDQKEIAPHLEEWRGKYQGKSPLLLKPASTAEVAAILAICNETKTAIVPQGGNTGLVGGQIPVHGEVLLSLQRMNKILNLDAKGMTMTVQSGTVLATVQSAAKEAEMLFPLSLASEGSCTIGGNIATNAGGTHVLRYGMMRSLVLGLEVVLADGRVLPMLTSLPKDNSGYDLKQMFIGSEGTLGVITAASLRLFPRPLETAVAFVAVPSPGAALDLLGQMRGHAGGELNAFELVPRIAMDLVCKHIEKTHDPLRLSSPWYVLVEIAGGSGAGERLQDALNDALTRDIATDAVMAMSEAQAQSLWRIRESISEAQRREGASVKHDISVPIAAVPAFIKKATAAVLAKHPGTRPVTFGHLGDGNLHFNFSAPPGQDAAFLAEWDAIQLIVHDIVKDFSGSISAEHGIGTMKRELLPRYKSHEELEVMRALKALFDPGNILNPGKTVPALHRL